MRKITNIFWLGTKELRSFMHDYVLLGLVIYAFSLAIIAQAQKQFAGIAQRLDRDRRRGSLGTVAAHRACVPAALFQAAATDRGARHRAADERRENIPSWSTFRRISSATCWADAGPRFRSTSTRPQWCRPASGPATRNRSSRPRSPTSSPASEGAPLSPVNLEVRIAFNPNVTTAWFTSVMGIINNVTMLAIILAGAAIVREREHGTMDHLLVMPLTPFEIAMSKIWATAW